MPKAQQYRIKPRAEVRASFGANPQSAARATRALGDTYVQSYIGRASTDRTVMPNYGPQMDDSWKGLALLSDSLRGVRSEADRYFQQEQEKDRVKGRAAFEAGEDWRDQKTRGLQEGWLGAMGATAGMNIAREMEARVAAGEWSPDQAVEHATKELKGLESKDVPLLQAALPHIESAMSKVQDVAAARLVEQQRIKSETSVREELYTNAFSSFDPANPATYLKGREASRQHALKIGMSGEAFNKAEFDSIMTVVGSQVHDAPGKALALLDHLGEKRADGTPSVLDSIPGARAEWSARRLSVMKEIKSQAEEEERKAAKQLQERTEGAYLDLATQVEKASTMDALNALKMDRFDKPSVADLANEFGSFRGHVGDLFQKRKRELLEGTGDASDSQAQRVAGYQLRMLDGGGSIPTVEEIMGDSSLSVSSKLRLRLSLKAEEQKQREGELTLNELSDMLLTNLSNDWGTKYAGSFDGVTEDPITNKRTLTPKGVEYVSELTDRLNKVTRSDSILEYNRARIETVRKLQSEILGGSSALAPQGSTAIKALPAMSAEELESIPNAVTQLAAQVKADPTYRPSGGYMQEVSVPEAMIYERVDVPFEIKSKVLSSIQDTPMRRKVSAELQREFLQRKANANGWVDRAILGRFYGERPRPDDADASFDPYSIDSAQLTEEQMNDSSAVGIRGRPEYIEWVNRMRSRGLGVIVWNSVKERFEAHP